MSFPLTREGNTQTHLYTDTIVGKHLNLSVIMEMKVRTGRSLKSTASPKTFPESAHAKTQSN